MCTIWITNHTNYLLFLFVLQAFSVFFICIAVTSDMICFLFIPVHWLFFAASTYVWVQYVWHTGKGQSINNVIIFFIDILTPTFPTHYHFLCLVWVNLFFLILDSSRSIKKCVTSFINVPQNRKNNFESPYKLRNSESWDAEKMIFFKCCLLCFNTEKIVTIPSINKVADETRPCLRRQFKKNTIIL